MDSAFNFVLRPQGEYKIVGGNFFGNALIVEKDGFFAVADTTYRLLSPRIKRMISSWFSWNGKHYFFGAWNKGQPVLNSGGTDHCFRCNCITVLDKRGHTFRPFRNYCIGHFKPDVTDIVNPVSDDGVLRVEDSLNHVGFVDLRGTIHYPAISFKYRDLHMQGGKLVTGRTDNGSTRVFDSENHDYFPALHIYGLSTVSASSPFSNGYQDVPGLREVTYTVKYSGDSFVYMNVNGTVYADADVLKQ